MNSVSYPNFRSWQAGNRSLVNVGIYSGASFNLASDEGAQWVSGGSVSWTMFRTLGVAPTIGRDFNEDEDRVGAPRVILLWQVIGRLKPSATVEQVRRDLGAIATSLETEYPGSNTGWGADIAMRAI